MDEPIHCDKNCELCEKISTSDEEEDPYSDAEFHQDLDRILISAGAVVALAAVAIGYFAYTKYSRTN